MADWMAYCLCGVLATDYTLAARTLLFDPFAGHWSDDPRGYAGAQRSFFRRLYSALREINAALDDR